MASTRVHFRAIRPSAKLSEQVEEQLERAILDGTFKVDGKLPTESELSATFKVSRTVIREAIQRLEAQGLIASRVGRGSFVVPYQMSAVRVAMTRYAALNAHRDVFPYLLDLRLLIESETSSRLAELRDAGVLGELRGILERMGRSTGDFDEFARADMDFHLCIARAAGNPLFVEILEPLKNVGRAFGLATYESIEGAMRVCRDHREILEAIEGGDGEEARLRMRRHIEHSRGRYQKLLDDEELRRKPSEDEG